MRRRASVRGQLGVVRVGQLVDQALEADVLVGGEQEDAEAQPRNPRTRRVAVPDHHQADEDEQESDPDGQESPVSLGLEPLDLTGDVVRD